MMGGPWAQDAARECSLQTREACAEDKLIESKKILTAANTLYQKSVWMRAKIGFFVVGGRVLGFILGLYAATMMK